jgi:hypothetical protein
VTTAPFPASPASGETVTAAVDRYLDSIKTRTTRSSYAGTLARLVSRAGGRDTASLLPRGLRRGDGPARRPPPGTGTCPRSPPSPHGPGGRRSSPPAPPAAWSAASPPAAAIGPSPASAWTSCSPTTGTACANGSCGGCSTRPPSAPGNSCPSTSRTSTRSSGVASSLPRAARPSTSTGPPAPHASCPGCYAVAHQGRCSSPALMCARVGFASPCRGGRLPGDQTRPAVLPARRVPVQAGHRRPRPAQAGLDAPPAPPLRPPAPSRRRTHRPRAPGQIPASAPGQPRPVRPARRADLRPGHRRRRPRRTTQDSLTKPE